MLITGFFPLLLGLCVVICLLSGIWLLLHLTALAALFRGKADIVPAPTRPRAPRGVVVGALVLFLGSLGGILALQTIAGAHVEAEAEP